MTSWFEWGTLGHAILWLPLALIRDRKSSKLSLITILALTLSLLAGHPQTSIYVILATIGYFLYRNSQNLNLRSKILYPLFFFLLPLLLAAPQVFPSVQVYMESAKNLIDGTSWARSFLIKPENLLTCFHLIFSEIR